MIDFDDTPNSVSTRITNDQYKAVAAEINVPVAALRSVVSVESSGSGFDSDGRPKALFERHIFFKLLASDSSKQAHAVDEGLAYPKWGMKPYPKNSDGVYEEINSAMKIDEDAALRSASWGLGQIMGNNFEMLGYDNVQDMVNDARLDEYHQIQQMAKFIKASGLDGALRNSDWAAFAKGYNGPGYAKNAYDQKLSMNYARFSAGSDIS
jgi:hypothetical protein